MAVWKWLCIREGRVETFAHAQNSAIPLDVGSETPDGERVDRRSDLGSDLARRGSREMKRAGMRK